MISLLTAVALIIGPVHFVDGKENKKSPEKKQQQIKIPKSVIDISKENTYPNPSQDEPELQPSEMTQALLETSKVPIENTNLIHLLNESNINTSKLSLGYNAMIYLGKWPLSYQSKKTTVNWQYKKVNVNESDNRGGKGKQKLNFNQEKQMNVTGGLTAEVPSQKDVKKLMMMKASKHTNLPIAFSTIIGARTTADRIYHVEPKRVGHLEAYVPAVNEKGTVTYGEVYLGLDGGDKFIKVKNVTQQGIGAWIPVQDYVSLKYHASK
ncbi:YfkD family protein [Tuberibacillus sp. Marseille-P3662]|uniref:YfkD family protein n=1 Tax=Tuberibacillus sp. Marseille-P3662 TaxID=1965358 RepID=UPI000A1C8BC7